MKAQKLYILTTFLFLNWINASCVFSQQNNFRNYSVTEGLAETTVNEIIQDFRGYLWLATNDGLSCYNGIKFTNYRTQKGMPGNRILSIVEDSDHIVLRPWRCLH